MATASDNFNRADQSPIAGNWETLGSDGVRLTSNQVEGRVTEVDTVSGWKASTNDFTDEQFSQCAVITPGVDDNGGVGVRWLNTAGGQGYTAIYHQSFDGLTNTVRLYKTVAGVWTQLGSNISADFTSGDILKISVETSSTDALIKAYKNGTQIGSTYTDSVAALTGGQPSVYYYRGNINVTKLDNWAGGDGTGTGGGGAVDPGIITGSATILASPFYSLS